MQNKFLSLCFFFLKRGGVRKSSRIVQPPCSNIISYTDDTSMISWGETLEELILIGCQGFNLVTKCFTENKLYLNNDKTFSPVSLLKAMPNLNVIKFFPSILLILKANISFWVLLLIGLLLGKNKSSLYVIKYLLCYFCWKGYHSTWALTCS